MIQDIITYMIVFYAVAYALRNITMVFIPEREKVKNGSCTSCTGCDFKRGCS